MIVENNSANHSYVIRKRIKLLGLSFLAAMVMLIALLISGAAHARSAPDPGAIQESQSPTNPAEVSCPADMISYWRLDETSGPTFSEDIMGLDASCGDIGCPTSTAGLVNSALAFDSIDDDGLTAPNAPQYNWGGDDSFTLELWVKTNACDDSVFFGKHSIGPSWWVGCGRNGNHPAFSLRDTVMTEEVRITASSSISDGNWHHLAAVHDGAAGEMRLYVDSVLEVTKTQDFAGSFIHEEQITFGFHADDYQAQATLDEVATYGAALSTEAIERHYQSGLTGDDYCNEIPLAKNGSYTTATNVPVSITLAYEDSDGPGPYTFTVVDDPDQGTLSPGSGANRIYTPTLGYTGNVSFTWQVNDGLDNSDIATVGIQVSTTGETEPPVADAQSVATQRNTPLPIELTYSDPDNGPGPYEITIVDGPDHGTLSGADVNWTYTPDTDYAGSDSFMWQVSDGIKDSNQATVSIEVQNLPPVAQSTGHQTRSGEAISIPLQYSDPDGLPGPYTFTIVDGPAHGSLSGSGDSRTYTPDGDYVGMDTFTWTVHDGADDSNVATATITVIEGTYWLFMPVINSPD